MTHVSEPVWMSAPAKGREITAEEFVSDFVAIIVINFVVPQLIGLYANETSKDWMNKNTSWKTDVTDKAAKADVVKA